jgi:murein DD-endopeptidase MepM/ murein hydrolase activator NlpD
MNKQLIPLVLTLAIVAVNGHATELEAGVSRFSKGYGIQKTGLVPKYPSGYNCSPLTSLYGSWEDVDGSKRDEPHSGVDGGRLGDKVFAPAKGVVEAAWKANWGWGEEGALLIRHSREELGLRDGPKYYYSEFDHLRYDDIRSFAQGRPVERGQNIATVSWPGGNSSYLPEVHWEIWEVDDVSTTTWRVNKYKGRYWFNRTAILIDPLYMLSLNTLPNSNGEVDIVPFDQHDDYEMYRGFTYILPCQKKTL